MILDSQMVAGQENLANSNIMVIGYTFKVDQVDMSSEVETKIMIVGIYKGQIQEHFTPQQIMLMT